MKFVRNYIASFLCYYLIVSSYTIVYLC